MTLRAPHDLPGLGPIRIRALEKAGYHSLSLLRAATLEQLLAVPGMSDPKARHIQTVLANAVIAEEKPADGTAAAYAVGLPRPASDSASHSFSTQPTRQARREPRTGEVSNKQSVPVSDAPLPVEMAAAPILGAAACGLSVWEREAERARQDIVALLTCPPAPNFRARLLRELVRFAAGMPVWKTAILGVGDKDQERALRRLRRLQDSLMETRVQQDIDRKTQARLAEDLAEASDRLYALSGQPEPARRAEDTHD